MMGCASPAWKRNLTIAMLTRGVQAQWCDCPPIYGASRETIAVRHAPSLVVPIRREYLPQALERTTHRERRASQHYV